MRVSTSSSDSSRPRVPCSPDSAGFGTCPPQLAQPPRHVLAPVSASLFGCFARGSAGGNHGVAVPTGTTTGGFQIVEGAALRERLFLVRRMPFAPHPPPPNVILLLSPSLPSAPPPKKKRKFQMTPEGLPQVVPHPGAEQCKICTNHKVTQREPLFPPSPGACHPCKVQNPERHKHNTYPITTARRSEHAEHI
jgi:hypothetical protein